MPQRNDGGYRLPTVVDPDEFICVQINVPNDLYHIIAFWGAIQELGYWWNWERDEARRGAQVAAVWRRIIEQARSSSCQGGNMRVRQRPGEPCKLDVDYGDGWEQFADLSLCPPEVSVMSDGSLNIGGTIVNPVAPLGIGDTGMPIQPAPRQIGSTDPTCAAAVNLAEILARLLSDVCAKIQLSPLEQALAAVGVFVAVLAYPPNVLWAIPLVAAIAATNDACQRFTFEDKEDLTCILKANAFESAGVVTFDRSAIQSALTATSRTPLMTIALLLNYIEPSALDYAASLPASNVPCPCPQPEQTVWLLSRADYPDQSESLDLPRSRWWEQLTYNPNTGLNRIVLRFDNVAAVQGLPSIGTRIRSWNSLSAFNDTTRSLFYVNYLKFTRANSAGVPLNVTAQLRVWPNFGGSPQIFNGTGSVEIRNLWAAQINTNAGVEGFNNNNEYWVIEFSIRTGRSLLSLRATNSLGQTVNWNRY